MNRVLIGAGALGLLGIVVAAAVVESLAIPPRELARYVERRASGHNPAIVAVGDWIGRRLREHDRGNAGALALDGFPVGARHAVGGHQPTAPAIESMLVPVTSVSELEAAIANARPGQQITLAPGVYRLGGRANVAVTRPGQPDAPITVRAGAPGAAQIEFDMTEGFRVSAPHWIFEGLRIRGVCREHGSCEHAFHVVGKAADFTARNNVVEDFNAHFKINGEQRDFPDRGTIEGNTLVNRSIRETDSPVTPIDLVGASGWRIRANLVADFVKGQGDRISYGAFAKGGAAETLIERNVVVCEHALRGAAGQRVGLSFGGGGSEGQYCRAADCGVEHTGGAIRANLIQSCSDDGIYVNRGRGASIAHNTLLDTGGIAVRYAAGDATVEGNLVDGLMRARDGARLRAVDNVDTGALKLYLGRHPVRALFADVSSGRLEWATAPPRRARVDPGKTESGDDLCGSQRPPEPAYGAFEDFAACLRAPDARSPRVN